MSEASRRIVHFALLALTIMCALAVDAFGILPRAVEGPRNGDYSTFYAAAHIDRVKLYDFDAITRAQEPIVGPLVQPRPYLNPPTYLPVLEALGRLPPAIGLALWATLTTLLFLAACALVAKPPAILLVAVSPVIWSTAAGGQVALLVGACIVAGMALLPKRPALAGVLFAAAALVKPPAVTLVPLALIAARNWRALAWCIGVGLAAGLAAVAWYGVDLWIRWLGALQEFSQFLTTSPVIEKGSSPATLVRLLHLGQPFAIALQVICGVAGVALVWRVFRRTEASLPRLAALTTGCLLVAPYAMTQELTPMLPAAATMLLDRRGQPLLWFASFLVVAMLLTPLGVLLMAAGLLAFRGEWRVEGVSANAQA